MWVTVPYVVLILVLKSVDALPEICMSPSGYTAVSMNSTALTHFHCKASEGEVFWEIRSHQFQNRDLHHSGGVVIEVTSNLTYTNLTLSKAGLDLFQLGLLPIRCYTSLGLSVLPIYSDYSYVVRYGAPGPPLNLQLIPTPSLHLSWQRPLNLHQEVPVEYRVDIVNLNTMSVVQQNTTAELTLEMQAFQPTAQRSCEPHSIRVVAMNDAGNSTDVSIVESIPFSPDVRPISQSLRVDSIDLNNGNNITINISFKGARECGDNYPIVNHTVRIKELLSSRIDINQSDTLYTVSLTAKEFPGLATDMKYTAYVIACTSITCHQSDGVKIYTSNIQSATVTFTHTSVYLSCTLTTGSAATGCHFTFSLANTTQFFNISRNDKNMHVCFPTHNQRDAYTDIEVSATDIGGNVMGVTQVPNITEDDSLSGCSSSDSNVNDLTTGAMAAAITTPITVILVLGVVIILVAICIVRKRKRVQVGKKTIVTIATAKEPSKTGGGTVRTDGVEGTDGVDGVESTDDIECTDGGDMNQEFSIGWITVNKKGRLQIHLHDTLEEIAESMKKNSSLELFVKSSVQSQSTYM